MPHRMKPKPKARWYHSEHEYPYYPYYPHNPYYPSPIWDELPEEDEYYYRLDAKKHLAKAAPLPPKPMPKPKLDGYYYEWTTMDAYTHGFRDGFDSACELIQSGQWLVPTPTPEPTPEPTPTPIEGT